jgi:hypothetical protein
LKCSEDQDGSCTVNVLLCNPDWEEPMHLACLRSSPNTGSPNQVSLFLPFDVRGRQVSDDMEQVFTVGILTTVKGRLKRQSPHAS